MEKSSPAVKRRLSENQRRYEDVRSREYLLPIDVDAMMKAIKKYGGRHAHRNATLVRRPDFVWVTLINPSWKGAFQDCFG